MEIYLTQKVDLFKVVIEKAANYLKLSVGTKKQIQNIWKRENVILYFTIEC